MSKTWLATISTIALMTVSPAVAHAKDISAKKVSIKDNANPAKRQVAVQSTDAGVLLRCPDPSRSRTPSATATRSAYDVAGWRDLTRSAARADEAL